MIKKTLDTIEKVIKFIVGILLVVMVGIIFMQVILRYCFQNATNWADELARYCMIWIVFLASPIGFRRNSHIKIDILIRNLPAAAQKVLAFAMYILEIVFLAVMIIAGWKYIGKVGNLTSVGMYLDMRWMYSAIIIGGVLMIVFILECIYNEYFARTGSGKEGQA